MSKKSLERILLPAALCAALGFSAGSSFGQVATAQTGTSVPDAPPKKTPPKKSGKGKKKSTKATDQSANTPAQSNSSTDASAAPASGTTPTGTVAAQSGSSGAKSADTTNASGDSKAKPSAKASDKLPGKGKAVLAKDASAEPDKVLFDRAQVDIKKGRYTEGRLTYQTLINTYPDSEYLAKAKLGVADSYFKEGGTSNITQAIQEYKDFITFFPFLDEAAYAQMQVAMAHYRMMEKPDRDKTQGENAEDEFQTFLLKYPQSPLVPKAEQSLRDVQEILADSQFRVAHFYYLKMNYAAAAARFVDLTERYPLYSESDEGLWMLADVYGRAKKASKNEDDKNHWSDLAAECYRRIITNYPLSHWRADAEAQLKAMNMPVPKPNPGAEEAMRQQQLYQKQHRQFVAMRLPMGMMKSSPNVTTASRTGQPNLNPPDDAISATEILKPGASGPQFNMAMRPTTASPDAAVQGAPTEAVSVPADSSSAPGNNLGVQIIDSGSGQAAATAGQPNAAAAATVDAAPSNAPTITLQPVDNSAAPAAGSTAEPSQTPAPQTGGTIAPDTSISSDKADSKTESTSKKKKGLKKLSPF